MEFYVIISSAVAANLCSISVCKSVDQSTTLMANSVNSNELHPKTRHSNHVHKSRKTNNHSNCASIPVCDRSRSAVIDVVILIAVIGACGFLLFPHIKFVTLYLIEFVGAIHYVVKEEVMSNPMIYASIGIGTFCAAIAAWIVIICTARKCGNPNCKGLRKAAEFDIQLETEECVKNSNGTLVKDGAKRGLFELPRDHHRELEAELKKMAPPNGRAVLVFRARCGCSVGRLEVPGPKKQKKVKK
ncbi:hypothetical protein GH714_012430 [Hevea brasiliensis]|uniref:Ribosomal protein L34e superfamily protein n=1 Tax=Hevea brasiliensis TaxID=3981 RepID=A0A6A6MMR1_HEVBR|nr:hypothetical protein GH714_012430 [Hevea brasiliensis]